MNPNPLTQGMLEVNGTGIGEVSGERVAARAKQLAMISGRSVSREDSEQAYRELTGCLGMKLKRALLEAASEDARWNPIPGSTGHQAAKLASEEEDEEGHSESAQLVEEGIREAEHDQMFQAAMTAHEEREAGH